MTKRPQQRHEEKLLSANHPLIYLINVRRKVGRILVAIIVKSATIAGHPQKNFVLTQLFHNMNMRSKGVLAAYPVASQPKNPYSATR